MAGGLRSYDDPCGIARALDRIGERWALLLVRELLLGPKRFTDLRAGLPDASPNVLSQRLRELEDAGVLQKRQLPPPAGATVYELTPWGRELEPVILALGRWGSRTAPGTKGELSTDAFMIALRTTFDPAAAEGLKARIELRVGAERFCAQIARKQLELTRGTCDAPDAVISADAASLRQLVFARKDLARMERAGEVTIEGDEALAARFLTLFPRPTPAEVAPGRPAT